MSLINVGGLKTLALFRIGACETVFKADDLVTYGMNVNFNFTAPRPAFGRGVNGITGAGWFFVSFGYWAARSGSG